MNFLDLLFLSLRMFKARTMRTFLTILGMSVGIAAILFLVSFGYGLQRTLLEKITTSDALVSLDITLGKDHTEQKLDQSTIDTIRQFPEVADVLPALELPGQGKFDNITLDVRTVSAAVALLKSEGLRLSAGRFFGKDEFSGIVITAAVAQVFDLPPKAMLGKQVSLTLFPDESDGSSSYVLSLPTSYTIVGIAEGDENTIYLPIDSLKDFTFSSYTKLKVKCVSTEKLAAARERIGELGLVASSISETVDQANKVFQVIQGVLMVFGLIALLVSAIGMFNTMTIALLERTEEIGIMKAIGASRGSISLMFIMEATIMGFLGSVGGVLLGFAEGEIVNVLVNLVAVRFGGTFVDLFYSPPWFVSTVIFFGAFVGFLTGVFPARKASRVDALEALRYK